MYDIFILSIYCTVKPTTTYTFISQKIKETQKKGLIYSYFTNWNWCTRLLSFACENNYKRGKKTFWFVDNIQNGLLIGSQISMNNLDTQVNLLWYKSIFCECMNENDWQHLTYLPILICRKQKNKKISNRIHKLFMDDNCI